MSPIIQQNIPFQEMLDPEQMLLLWMLVIGWLIPSRSIANSEPVDPFSHNGSSRHGTFIAALNIGWLLKSEGLPGPLDQIEAIWCIRGINIQSTKFANSNSICLSVGICGEGMLHDLVGFFRLLTIFTSGSDSDEVPLVQVTHDGFKEAGRILWLLKALLVLWIGNIHVPLVGQLFLATGT